MGRGIAATRAERASGAVNERANIGGEGEGRKKGRGKGEALEMVGGGAS